MYFIYVCIWKRWIQNKFVIFPMMSFALMSPKKCNVHLCQKLPFVHACFQASAAPPPENSESDEKDALFGLYSQTTIFCLKVYLYAAIMKTN
jgi:hypothetical protein